jgi:hypothetical protein
MYIQIYILEYDTNIYMYFYRFLMICVGCAKTLQGKTRAIPAVVNDVKGGGENSKNEKKKKNEKNPNNEKKENHLGQIISDARGRNRLFTEADLGI